MIQITKHLRKVCNTFHGKDKGRMVHVAQDILVWAMKHGYHGVLVRLEAIPTDETVKKLAALTDMTSNKKTIQQLQNEHKSLCRSTTVLYSRHHIQHWHLNDYL